MNSHVVDVIADLGEAALDSLCKNELVKNIPILGTFVGLYRAYNDLKSTRFCKRLKKIIDDVEESEFNREEFYNMYHGDTKQYEYLFSHLINVIDSIEEEEKTDMIANLFCAFLLNKINKEEFRRFMHIASSYFYYDLKWLIDFNKEIFAHESLALQGLIGTCLVEQAGIDGGTASGGGGYYYIRTEEGKKFCEMAFTKHRR